MLKFPSPSDNVLPDKIPIVSPTKTKDHYIDQRIVGSLVGLAIGDALGASVEFRPYEYLVANPVHDMMPGGTWGLAAGQWTDDTTMALCLASSLITCKSFNPYDQMVRYKWWYRYGYLSSTGQCFDIGNATRTAIEEFQRRQVQLAQQFRCQIESDVDKLSLNDIQNAYFDVNCSEEGVAGNGALMRLAPVPLFFRNIPNDAVEFSGQSARLTHGDDLAVDACRYYGALIVGAVRGEPKDELLSNKFFENHIQWFGSNSLHDDVRRIVVGESYKKSRGYEDGIRGKGHIIYTLEAALWAFWSTETFKEGALAAVNLGDDTDTTAAVYGQLAGAFYGFDNIPKTWRNQLYAKELIICIAEWLQYLGPSTRKPFQREKLPEPSSSTLVTNKSKKQNRHKSKQKPEKKSKEKKNSSMIKCLSCARANTTVDD